MPRMRDAIRSGWNSSSWSSFSPTEMYLIGGRVEDDGVAVPIRKRANAVARHVDGIAVVLAVDRDVDLLAELLELVDRGGPLQVGGDEPRLASRLAQEERELRGCGRLPRSL